MNIAPLVSVIMPSYNSKKYIKKAIDSVLEQTYSNFELIIVDGNSTDGTLDILDEYKKRQAEALVLSFADDDVEDDRELVALVQKALSQLSEQQRRIVELHVMEGMKYLEIADLLQLSENTVRTHLKRAYKILRENLSCLVLDIFF